MTSRSGGRIPADGKPRVSGVGKNSQRTDMSAPATPGLHESDLQQGDVSMLTEGQRVAPIRNQPSSRTSTSPRKRKGGPIKQQGGPQSDLPDPIDFFGDRLAGTYATPDSSITPRSTVDVQMFLPLLERIATAPGASGVVSQAYLTLFANAMNRPFTYETPLIDMQDADEDLTALLGA